MNTAIPSSFSIPSASAAPFKLFREPGQPRKSRVSQNRIAVEEAGVFDRPQLLTSPFSDRVAILDAETHTYCAYSLIESVNKSGLDRFEAEEWIQGRLMIKPEFSSHRALFIAMMIIASWGGAAFGIWSLIELLF